MRKMIVAAAIAGAALARLVLVAGADPLGDPALDTGLIGTNERLIFVVAGSYATQADAAAANAGFAFGDLQGFYLVPTSAIEGQIPGRWLVATAFRTDQGAVEFEELAAAVGVPSASRVAGRYLGSDFVGLGQEPHPDGTGPLTGPVAQP